MNNSKKHVNYVALKKGQQGAVAIMVALAISMLLGFAGLALDLGKLFVTKTELQNSADACALAAARELRGVNIDQLKDAEFAGIATGTRNKVMFQDEAVIIQPDDHVTFSDKLNGTYLTKSAVANILEMKYARCTVERKGIWNWFMWAVGVGDQQVKATAVATNAPSQTFSCAIPIGICQSAADAAVAGSWLKSVIDPNDPSDATGDFGWIDFGAYHGTNDLKGILTGQCEVNDLPDKDVNVTKPGLSASIAAAWNSRFGIYFGDIKQPTGPGQSAAPDRTGFAYYPGIDGSPSNAPSAGQVVNVYSQLLTGYQAMSGSYAPYQGNNDPQISLTDLKPKNGDSPLNTSEYKSLGQTDRRLAIVAITEGSTCPGAVVNDWACVLMLHPINTGGQSFTMWVEYLGKADDENSPCGSIGVPGGGDSTGPRVPTLVQ